MPLLMTPDEPNNAAADDDEASSATPDEPNNAAADEASSATPDEPNNAAADDESKKEDAPAIQVDEEASPGPQVPDEADPLSVSKLVSEVEQTDKGYKDLKIKQTPSMDARKNEIKKGIPTPTASDIDNILDGQMSL